MATELQIITSKQNLKKANAERVLKGRTEKKCEGCGKLCSIQMARVRKGWRYCSWDCRVKNLVGENGTNSGGGAWMVGELNINYKHGNSSETLKRDLTKVNQWRRRVFEKDKYKCQKCGYDKGKILRAHHIYSWADFPDKRYDLENGITLCNNCHKWVHSKQNTLKEFILCK